ncbi:hypothetical protein BDF20DRAFT_905604 [Mycotypha africana]|uniref:uncharacterized protein n=1 Tax=Mycotypha africana TaxID=64632 RepID=UPI00230199FB|nr:uncharacterized protein BDF20DRAFT_905604 [Mycotypha africana]KAI8981786.1 hypothetical protein BDF20DRAFT_905604 [Mycotypha africana]
MSLRSVSHSLISNLKSANRVLINYPCRRTCNNKKTTNHPPRRVYLYDQYSDIINNNRAVFIFQNNNLGVNEFTQLRQHLFEVSGQGAAPTKLTVVQTGIFSAALRQTKYANLETLLSGPICIFSTNADDAEHPDLLKKSVEGLAKNKKLLLLGGKIDDTLLTQADVLKVVDLPPLQQLRGQLVGTIEAPARRLLQTLEQPAGELHSVLDRRI